VTYKRQIWDSFCERHSITNQAVPLFQEIDGAVETFTHGKGEGRLLLRRSPEMDAMVIREVAKVLEDHAAGTEVYEGLIYMMFRRDSDDVIPIYVGKSEKFGKTAGGLSANIANIEHNLGKFSRWGYAYHIGDLSAVVCPGHAATKNTHKYARWAERLFRGYPSAAPRLKEPAYFWITAWKKCDVVDVPGLPIDRRGE
jgi:hypothetical protein